MQLTTTHYLLKSAVYAICSIACLAIHLVRLAENGLVTRRTVGSGIIIRLYKYLGMMGLYVGVNTHSHIKKGG